MASTSRMLIKPNPFAPLVRRASAIACVAAAMLALSHAGPALAGSVTAGAPGLIVERVSQAATAASLATLPAPMLAQDDLKPSSGNAGAGTGGTDGSGATGAGDGGAGTGGDGATKVVPPGGYKKTNQGPGGSFFLIMILVLVAFWVFAIGGQRKEKKKRAELLAGIKKGDRVQTIGGILGSVVELKDAHVVLKVDENNNTRLKFSRAAIQGVVEDDAKKEE